MCDWTKLILHFILYIDTRDLFIYNNYVTSRYRKREKKERVYLLGAQLN